MVITILLFVLCVICSAGISLIAWLQMRKFDKERAEWSEERSKLLDRIQSGSLTEFKAQERADTPVKRRVKDPETLKLEGEPWA